MYNVITPEKDGSVILTAPVMIPDVPDCDFSRGEPPLTKEQIRKFAESYEKYQFIDHEHQLEYTGQKTGKPLDSFILPEDSDLTLIDGSKKSYPAGTWMLSTRITTPEAVETALNGGYSGYSPTVKNREVADRLASALKSETLTYSEFLGACKSHSMDGLIKDVVDPVVLSVTLTKKPCQHHSRFCKHNILGEENMSDESTLDKIRKILGDSDSEDVSALKSQVDTLEEKMDAKFEEMESSFKSMSDSFNETLKESLKEIGAGKSEDDDEDDEPEDDNNSNDDGSTSNNDENNSNDDEDDEPEDDDTNNPQSNKNKGASKSRPLHNNNDKIPPAEKSTYVAMGRNPDGTAKTI